MKTHQTTIMALLAVILSAGVMAADMPRKGAPVFTDGFDQPGTFAENWGKPHGRVKSEGGCLVANAIRNVTNVKPRREAPLEVIVEGSITIQDEGRRIGWTGFSLDGYLFLLTTDGRSWLNLNKKLKAKDNGKRVRIGGYKTGSSVKLTVTRRKRGSACVYSFYANGMPAGTFTGPIPEKPGMPAFATYDLKATLDDIGVYALADENESAAPVSDANAKADERKK